MVMLKTEHQINAINSEEAMHLEHHYGAHNYKPLPAVISKGQGVHVWNPEGGHYYDFLAAYSALNQGHCHPRIVNALTEQAQTLTLTSRAFYNNLLGSAEKMLSETFGYDKVLFMNSGAEAVETAIKVARKWGYQNKSLDEDRAKILVVTDNFHGRTINVISFSTSDDSREGFGPFNPGYEVIPYNDVDALDQAAADPEVVGFLVEPIQGEAGVVMPDEGYLKKVREICNEHNILFIDDEIQTGIGRTGKMLCADHEEVRPDIIILGKALSGGMMPVSAVLADDSIMLAVQPGEHGSTFGGNPIAARIAIESLQVVMEEGLIENAADKGPYFRERMHNINTSIIKEVRGKGLLNAVEIDEEQAPYSAKEISKMLIHNGLLAKQTHETVIRFTPPLVINQEELKESCDIIEQTFKSIG